MKDTFIIKVEQKLRGLGIPYTSVSRSSRVGKKVEVVINGRTIHFGASSSMTYLEGASKQKRDQYRKRHGEVRLKDGGRAIDVKYSPAWLSWHVLW